MTTTTNEPAQLSSRTSPGAKHTTRGSRHKVDTGVWQHGYGQALPGLNPTGGPSVLRLSRGDWKMSAACVGQDQARWFAEADAASPAAAQACGACPVRDMCLAAGLVFHEEFGVWGGLTPRQRQPLLRRLAAGEPLGDVLADAIGTATEAA